MKQIASNYTYNKTSGVITLIGVNIDRDQLLLIVNTTRNVTYYNFADSTTTLQAFTQGANTSITLASSVVSASSTHNNADALTIYYDDQVATVTANVNGVPDDNGVPYFGVGYFSSPGGALIQVSQDLNCGLPVTATTAQGTAVTNTNFTSITPSTSLVSAVAGRRVLSVFNEGAGLLYISGGGTCTTTSYQVRLGMGGYWECPAGQLALAHTGVFGTIGTARVSQVS